LIEDGRVDGKHIKFKKIVKKKEAREVNSKKSIQKKT